MKPPRIIRIPARDVAKIITTIQAEIESIEFSYTDYTDGRIHDVDVLEDLRTWEKLLEALGGKRPAKYVPPGLPGRGAATNG